MKNTLITAPNLFANPRSIYPELQKDFQPALMKDFPRTQDKNSCEVVGAYNLLLYYTKRRGVKNLLLEEETETLYALDRSIGRLPIIGGQIGLGALVGTLNYLKKYQGKKPKNWILRWPTTYNWVERSIREGDPVVIGLFNHKKYGHHAVCVLGCGVKETGRFYLIADGWSTTSTYSEISYDTVFADGWGVAFS